MVTMQELVLPGREGRVLLDVGVVRTSAESVEVVSPMKYSPVNSECLGFLLCVCVCVCVCVCLCPFNFIFWRIFKSLFSF